MEIAEVCPQADVSAHSGSSPEVSRAFLAMVIFCTEYFYNDVLSPFSQSLTPHFQMFTFSAQDQTLSGETTQKQQNFPHLPCQAQLLHPNLSTDLQLGMWLKPDALPSTLFTLNCTNLLPVHFPLSSFQRAAAPPRGFLRRDLLVRHSSHRSLRYTRLKTVLFPPALHDGEQSTAWELTRYFWVSAFQQFTLIQGLWSWRPLYFAFSSWYLYWILCNPKNQWSDSGKAVNSHGTCVAYTTENVENEVCGEFYFQTFFSLNL